jgi:beta-xylosidase
MLVTRPLRALVIPMVALASIRCDSSSARHAPVSSREPPSSSASPRVETYPWVPDRGDGTYQNPVLFADDSDPDAIRVGDEYFLTTSSFQLTPALPLLRSRDLVNWSILGYALENLPQRRYEEVRAGAGVWAPSIREHAGTFYIFAPFPDEGIYVLTAPHPRGPWSQPRLLLQGQGLIDPCPLWDDDGKAYLVHAYAKSRSGIKDRLRVLPMTPDASSMLGEGRIVYQDPDRHPTLEGPKFYKHNGWYYILAPAGGVRTGWQVALRSREVFGPYTDRVVLEQGRTAINGPHQGALVDTPSGQWWFLHFQDLGLYGRVVHLNPVVWEDDWPVMGTADRVSGKREPVLMHAKPIAGAPVEVPATSDELDGGSLGLQWQWYANHRDDWYSLTARPGYLRLYSRPALPDFAMTPNFLSQKLPARSFTVETSVELGAGSAARAGLAMMGESHAALSVEHAQSGQLVTLRVVNRLVHSATVADGAVRLSLAMADGGMCRFFYRAANDAEPHLAGTFQARAGKWIGARIGIFAVQDGEAGSPAPADFDYFRFAPPAP